MCVRAREKKLTTTAHKYVEADYQNSDADFWNSDGQNFFSDHQNSAEEHHCIMTLILP